jgi:HD-GYP domain-containing protein (c-di-GMP phosphodiesterase class II)
VELIEAGIKKDFPVECEYLVGSISQHHEREEGQGYPQKLTGDNINLPAKILGLADTYEAMCHIRFHRVRQTTYRALQEVVSMKKSHFDPRILRALVNELTFFPIGCYVKLNTDEIGIVVDTSLIQSMRPKVRILFDSEGERITEDKVIDLVESPFLYVVKPLDNEDFSQLK